jgi:hypothetical protein
MIDAADHVPPAISLLGFENFPAWGRKIPCAWAPEFAPNPLETQGPFRTAKPIEKDSLPVSLPPGIRLRVPAKRTRCSLGRTKPNAVLAKRTQRGFGQTNPTRFWPNKANAVWRSKPSAGAA